MDKKNRKESKAQKNQVEALTIKEEAEFLGVRVNTLGRWIIKHGLPHVQLKKERKILFLKKSLLAWVKENRGNPSARLRDKMVDVYHVFTFYEWFSKKCGSFVIFTNSPGKVEGKGG